MISGSDHCATNTAEKARSFIKQVSQVATSSSQKVFFRFWESLEIEINPKEIKQGIAWRDMTWQEKTNKLFRDFPVELNDTEAVVAVAVVFAIAVVVVAVQQIVLF